jgi:hypothetical protein
MLWLAQNAKFLKTLIMAMKQKGLDLNEYGT